ncbi:hypothetical protein CRE_02667 [Caenorhabditis remanei]|uniref:Uncharacterized protein n=1 Tax=Caenorhabditis remanei TaxID=31234 RepID=E3NHW3_CAERE|nr:hypothetical protein CRE_02667 [Caenorhabditis remanei]
MGAEIIAFCFSLSFPSEDLHGCQYTRQSHMQRNAWFVIIAVFSAIFSLFFKVLELINKRIENHSVRNDYVFSCRYQIRENVRTCRFAFSLLLLFFVFFFIFFLFDRNLESQNEISAARREYLFLIFPMFALIYSLHFLTANSSLFETAKRALQSFHHQEHGRMNCCHDKTHIV